MAVLYRCFKLAGAKTHAPLQVGAWASVFVYVNVCVQVRVCACVRVRVTRLNKVWKEAQVGDRGEGLAADLWSRKTRQACEAGRAMPVVALPFVCLHAPW